MITDLRSAWVASLTPLSFLQRAQKFLRDRTAIIYGDERFTYGEFGDRVSRLAAALTQFGVSKGDTVAILAPNIPAMLEAHYAVPMIGAVLNPINFRLDAEVVGGFLKRRDAKLLICDSEFLDLARKAIGQSENRVPIIVINDPAAGRPSESELTDYEDFIGVREVQDQFPTIEDEGQALSLLYTSGTTGIPKGVVYSHRGAYLAAMSNALSFRLKPGSIFLWTWPMFHSNGLSFIWGVTAVGGTHICARVINEQSIVSLIAQHHVSHFCATPLVLKILARGDAMRAAKFTHRVNCITGGSPPPPSILAALERAGVEVTHQYGASECYGPATIAVFQETDDPEHRYHLMSRQGIPTVGVEDLIVADIATQQPIARDGATLGEVLLRGNTVAKSYLAADRTVDEAISGQWYRTGDIAVWHEDGSIEIVDRSQDMIISGGENVSSVEIENVLFKHPEVSEVAVVAKPHDLLDQIPCAFVDRISGSVLDAGELERHCREFLPDSKIPREFFFQPLPKTATGKIQKNMLRQLVLAES